MTANYPTIVRKFQPHQDGTEYVMAAHMNDVQDETAATQQTLGIRPHIYTAASGTQTSYASVAARLDAAQRKIDAQQAQIDQLLDASKSGWSLPIVAIHGTNTVIPATKNTNSVQPSDWYSQIWNRKYIDTNGAYSPGPYITIPKTGWWILTARTMMETPDIPNNVEHTLWGRMRVISSTNAGQETRYDLAAGNSSSQGDEHGWHRLTQAAAWAFYAGDRVSIQLRHDFFPTDVGQSTPAKTSQVALTRAQMTYIRGLPSGTIPDVYRFPDEIDT